MTALIIVMAMQAALAQTTVAQGSDSQIIEPRQVVIRSESDWTAFWRLHSPDGDAPRVDFASSIVVGVLLGTRPTAGYRVDIVAVRMDGSRAVVEYRERSPSPGALLAQILTSPFHLVRVAGRPSDVEFRKVDG
jgi:hypothetical protein